MTTSQTLTEGELTGVGAIDVSFDFRSDTPSGKDPDSHSPTLRRYHKWLWSKPLPNGLKFELLDTTPHVYLHHRSALGEFWLSSDSVVPTFTRKVALRQVLELIPSEDLASFNTLGYTIGGMMIFPGQRVGGKMTINGARGFHPYIQDRFDLTVECIRRHYSNKPSPLRETFDRYREFFDLFESFPGFVEFFLLQDLVTADYSEVKYFHPFQDFNGSPLPKTRDEYLHYKHRAMAFLEARNHRISRLDRPRPVA